MHDSLVLGMLSIVVLLSGVGLLRARGILPPDAGKARMGAGQGKGTPGERRGGGGPRLHWGAGLAGLVPSLLLSLLLLLLPCLVPPALRAMPNTTAAASPDAAVIELRGRLLEDPRSRGSAENGQGSAGCRAPLQSPDGPSELLFPAPCPPLQEGWWVAASGRLRQPTPAPHPLLHGTAERLARQGITSQLALEHWELLRRPATPVADLRRRIGRLLAAVGGEERGGLLAALVLGSAMVPLPAEVREVFRAAGLSHALAASGFHLSVLLGAVLPLGRRLPRPLRLLLAAGAMGLFLLLAGFQASVVRAVLMAGAALLLVEGGRRGRPVALLLTTVVLMLLLRPDWLWDVGFQLSVAATAGLIVSARPLEGWLHKRLGARLPQSRAGGRLAAGLAAALAVPLAATAWTLPLQVLHFGVVPLYGVPANLLAAPLLTPLTLGAMALGVVALVLPAALPLLAPPVLALAQLLLLLCRGVAHLPMAQWQTGRPLPVLVLLLAVGTGILMIPALATRRRRLGLALIAAAVAFHLLWIRADRFLLVHQGSRDLLVARHQGRAALISRSSDGPSCRNAAALAAGLGIGRYDWLLLLDPVASETPHCWKELAGLTLSTGETGVALLPGQTLHSPGLEVRALNADSRALQLRVGRQQWLLLPDRQALWAWNEAAAMRSPGGLWLGFRPGRKERSQLRQAGVATLWWSGPPPPGPEPLPPGWQASGTSGSLQTA
ncbi:MAG: ComEC/Rec2 family competence protein [Prochlorococcaceae cyanobacterium]|jgi:competence protein ComEC